MPDRIGKYEIRGELGKGGFGHVYLGYDPAMDRQVAIKVLSSADPSLLARFRQEAMAAGNLHHKNIVTIHAFGEDQGTFFMVMEYLEGRDLHHVLADKTALSLVEKMRIMSQVAEGLQCAHQSGIVHRDVKPANIMVLSDGTVKVMDFGIARLTRDNSTRLTQSGFLIGTISYMAPEQLAGGEADVLCDIWAFGTIYYELLGGMHPFEANDAASAMFRIMQWQPERIKALVPECPQALDNVVAKLLSKDRDNRYQTMEDVLFDTAPILLDLETRQAGELVSAAQMLIREGKLDDGQRMVRRILALDPLSEDGRALRQELQTAFRRRSISARVDALVAKAEEFAAAQDYANAIQSLESALQIDPGNAVLTGRLAELKSIRERGEMAKRLLDRARSDADVNNLTSAFQGASDALSAEPGNVEARRLLAQIQARLDQRDAEARRKEALAKARGLLAMESFDEAIEILSGLAHQAPEPAQVGELLEHARQQREEHQRRRFIRSEIDAAKDAIKTHSFEAAIARLTPLASEAVCAQEVGELLAYANTEWAAAQRAATIKSLGNEAWLALKAKDFDGAQARVEAALRSFPDDAGLLKLEQAIRAERAQQQRRAAVQQTLDEVAACERGERWDEAVTAVQKALRQHPGDRDLNAALEQIAKARAESQERARVAALERELQHARELLNQGQAGEATKMLDRLSVSFQADSQVVSLRRQAEAEQQRAQAQRERQEAERERQQREAAERERREAAERERQEAERRAQEEAKRREATERQRQEAAERERQEAERQRQEAERKRAEAEAERRAALEADCTVIRKYLNARQLDSAREAIARGRARFGQDPKFTAFEAEAAKLSARAEQLERAQRGFRERNWKASEKILESLLAQDPGDGEARALLAEVKSEAEAERAKQRRSAGRKEAAKLLQSLHFDEAIRLLRALHDEFPEHQGISDDLRDAQDAKERHLLRDAYAQGRQQAEALRNKRQFDDAMALLEKLRAQFPEDQVLQQDLVAVAGAKRDYLRQERYTAERRRAAELVRTRKFDDAIRSLEALQGEFPNDPILQEELKTAAGAKELQERREALNREVQQLEKLYRKGDARGVLERAGALAPDMQQDARVRELLDWAQTELGRPRDEERQSADALRAKRRQRVIFTVLAAAVVAVAILFWLMPKPGILSIRGSELSFDVSAGGAPVSQSTAVESRGGGKPVPWTVSVTDAWLSAQPAQGVTPQDVTVTVDPRTLTPGSSLTTLLIFSTAGGAPAQAKVKVNVRGRPPEITTSLPPKLPAGGNPPSTKSPAGKEPTKKEPTLPVVPSPATQPPAVVPQPPPPAVTPPSPPPEIVDCHAATYGGLRFGNLVWTGVLAPNGTQVIDNATARGKPFPGCDVTVKAVTPGISIEEAPSRADGFRRVRVRNTTAASVAAVELRWDVK